MPARSISVRQVAKHFGAVEAVRPLDLDVEAGEFLTLLGPSGCGKTTLLRLIAGLEQVTAGRILVGGTDVTDLPPNARDTSIMFQDYALFPHKSVADNIAYGLKMRRVAAPDRRLRALEWLRRIGLEGYGDRLPHALSGGQRQRVALARSLILEPGVLLLDEPLGALDANLRRQLQVELKRLHRDVGITFLAVTHDQEEAITMSDRIAVMRDGRVEQIGTPQDIYDRPRTEFVARFIGRCNVIDGTVAGVENGLLRVETSALGTVLAEGSADLPDGRAIRLAVRPDAVEIASGREAGFRVREIVFTGGGLRFEMAGPDGSLIEAETRRQDGAGLALGDVVSLGARPGTATVLETGP